MALSDQFSSGSTSPQPEPVAAAPAAHHHGRHHAHHQPGRMISGHRPHQRRKAGDGAPASVPQYDTLDDMIRATVASPSGRAFVQQADGTFRQIDGLSPAVAGPGMPAGSSIPGAPAGGAMSPAEQQMAQVFAQFPEVTQPGRASRRFARKFAATGYDPAQAHRLARHATRR